MNLRKFLTFAISAAFLLAFSSCKDTKSYAELLNEETKAVNAFLADQNVILDIPADSIFEYGPDAPFYRIDSDGNVFMQVIEPGDKEKVKDDAMVFFRFTRYNLNEYALTGSLGSGYGNSEDVSMGSASFRFNNYTLTTSSQWGSGIQMPLNFLGFNSHVRLVIKSQFGLTSEISQVIPFLYDIRYLPAVSE
ncbi:MAG: DUF4827 domain-containing protein [Muribaculaceae bacterium]|nr:DUF4827 domain-containing protein [Muribaculaceae bacterium]